MSFNDKELEKIKKEMNIFIEERRPPEEIRNQLDLSYKIEKLSIYIYEIRKISYSNKVVDIPFAKATYVIKDKIWKIYWKRADLKWYLYETKTKVKTIKDFLRIVDEDSYGCFWS